MTFDPITSIGNIQQLASTLSNLGPELSSAARTGSFGAIFSQVNSELAAASGSASEEAGSSSAGQALSTASLLPDASGAPSGSDVVTDARHYLGVQYKWGGSNPATGLDCSGLVQRVYGDLGISVPRTSQEQAQVGTPVSSLADAQPGDLVFFAGSDGTASAPGHVGIYIGNGQMIDAPHTGTVVQVQSVGTPVAIRRILPAGTSIDLAGYYNATGSGGTGASTTAGDPGMATLGVPANLAPAFQQAGQRYGVSPLLLASVAKQESGFQANAVSSAGAVGMMQLMPATAAGLGVNPSDPASAIDGAAQLLSGYLSRYGGSVPLALAAYNAGPGSVSQYGGVPPYGETQHYVSNITAMLARAQAAETAGVAA